eukprot:794384-Alexandrium_andersonii.AAC.1
MVQGPLLQCRDLRMPVWPMEALASQGTGKTQELSQGLSGLPSILNHAGVRIMSCIIPGITWASLQASCQASLRNVS